MHNAKATLRLRQGQSFLFSNIWKKKAKIWKCNSKVWLQTGWSFEEEQHAQKGPFPPLELAALHGVVSTCRSRHRSVQEEGFYPGKHTAVATPCFPQGKISLRELSRKGWLLWKQQRVKLRQRPVLVMMFSCSEWLHCKAGDAGHQG